LSFNILFAHQTQNFHEKKNVHSKRIALISVTRDEPVLSGFTRFHQGITYCWMARLTNQNQVFHRAVSYVYSVLNMKGKFIHLYDQGKV